ncbi:MAG: hypothetical protein OXF11_17465 [Deltaproteobacteria bacterium]|nr:hypothetical protein [Deltaproteobacteria bacterium]
MLIAAALVLFMAACSSNSGIKSERDDYKTMAEDLQGQVDSLTEMLSTARGQIATLEGDKSALVTQVDDLTGMRDHLQGQLDQLLANGRPEDTQEIADLTAQIGGLNTQIDGLNAEIGGLNTQIDGLNGQIVDLTSQVGNLNGQVTSMTTQIEGLNGQVASLNAEVLNLNGQITALNGMIDGLDGQITELTGMRDAYKAQAEELLANGRPEDGQTIQGLNDQITGLNTQIMTLGGQVTDLTGQVGTLTTERDGLTTERDGLQTQLDAANLELDGDGTDANPGLRQQVADLQTELEMLKEEQRDTEADRMRAQRMSDEEKLRAAMLLNRADTPSTTDPVDVTNVNRDLGTTANNAVMIERDAAGEVTVETDSYEDTTGQAGTSDWTPVMLTEGRNTVVLYTDIDAPADRKFNDVYLLAVRGDILNDAARLRKASSSSFPTGVSQTVEFGGTSGNDANFSGSFDGVDGTYECIDAGGCELTTDAEGDLAISDMWRFTPNSNLATVKVPDTSYVYFGWWLTKPRDEDDPWDVEVFINSTENHAATVATALEGSATYSGTAAGKFVTKTFSAGVHSDSSAGHFTANATLTADFDDAAAAGSIEGSISGFTLNDTDSVPWVVTLEEADLSDGASNFSGTTEINFGGGKTSSDPGTWVGSFFDAETRATIDAEDRFPKAVAGKFDAVTPGGAVLGAFGASQR